MMAFRYTKPRFNVVDPLFMRRIKKAYANYAAAMEQERTSAMPKEAYVDIDEKGPAWYLGHMSRTSRVLEEKLDDIDFFIELRDARLPFTTENPFITKLTKQKPRIIVFNKADLSNEEMNRTIHDYLEDTENCYSLFTSANRTWKDTVMAVQKFVEHVLPPKQYKLTAHVGCVVGMPNIGKSTLINSLRMAHEFQFHREDMRRPRGREEVSVDPGSTRSVKLVPLSRDPNIVLYDTPGLTLPGNVHKEAGLKLAACGILPTNTLTLTDAAVSRYIYEVLHCAGAEEHLAECLHLPRAPLSFEDCIMMLCERSGASSQSKMGAADFINCYKFIIGDFQLGRLGRITLDRIPKKMLPTTTTSSSYQQQQQQQEYASEKEQQNSEQQEEGKSQQQGETYADYVIEHTIESTDVVGDEPLYVQNVLKSVHNSVDSGKIKGDASFNTVISRKRGPVAANNNSKSNNNNNNNNSNSDGNNINTNNNNIQEDFRLLKKAIPRRRMNITSTSSSTSHISRKTPNQRKFSSQMLSSILQKRV